MATLKKKYFKTNVDNFFSYKGKMYKGEWPTIREGFEISLSRFPSNNCFLSFHPKREVFTYSEVNEIVRNIAYCLIENGIKKGDHVAVSGKNSPQWAIVYLAITFSGAIIVPLDYALHPDEMTRILEFGDVKALFMDDEKIDLVDLTSSFIKNRFSLESSDKYQYCLSLKGKECELPQASCDECAAILFTSGTTGNPKGVMLSHKSIVASTLNSQRLFDVYDHDVFYAILPIHHAYTMTAVFMETIFTGASCVFGKKLITPIMLKELKEGGVTKFIAVPILFNKLLSGIMKGVEKQGKLKSSLIHFLMGLSGFCKKAFNINIGKKMFSDLLLKKVSLDKVDLCISGAGPLPSSTFKAFNEIGLNFVQGYGLTETAPIININPAEAYIEESVGIPLEGMEEKIVDPDEDGNGLIYVRGPQVMLGYYKNEEATKEVLSSDGWLNTGDVGHIDKNGYLYLTGRAKSVIVTEGGKNVFPEEIEDKFQLFEEINQLCIIPYVINKEMKTEGIRIVIYPSPVLLKEKSMDEVTKRMEEIVALVNRNLQSYKKITMITVVDSPLPMTSTNKVKRFEVVKLFKDK